MSVRDESEKPEHQSGRKDEVGRTGIWPASGPWPPGHDVPIVGQSELGQGTRGASGYADAGSSEFVLFRTDPVFGVNVNPEHAEHAEYRDDVYFFDSADCRRRFEETPERFTGTPDQRKR